MMGELRWATEYAITNSLRKIESKLTLDVRIWYRVLLRNCKIENNNSLIGTSHHSGVEIGSHFLELFVHLKYFTGVLMQQIGSLCEDTILVISARRECEKVIGWCQNASTVLIVHWECVFDRLLWKFGKIFLIFQQCHRMNPISFCTSGRSFCLFSELKVFPVHWVVNQNRHIYNDKK